MSRKSGFKTLLPATMLALAVAWTGVGAGETNKAHRFEIGVQGGLFLPDQDISEKNSLLQELEPVAGPRFAFLFGKRFDLFVDAGATDMNVNAPPLPAPGDIETLTYRTGVNLYSKPHGKNLRWFLGLGAGIVDYDLETLEDFERTVASVSVGQRIQLDERVHGRWELRADQALDDDDLLEGEDLTRANFIIGIHWGLGRSCNDADGDGVCARDDRCPDTPACAIVDEHGCPIDSDGDGVPDGCDKCPDTPDCAVVDEHGCPIDSDGDGVPDGCDKCPDTPACAVVDEHGCPLDSDGDGVPDGCDRCPDTPPGTKVKPDGCKRAEKLFKDPEKKTLVLEGVYFEFDKAILKPESRVTLDRVAESLRDWPEVRVEVAGHTDWIGDDNYNLDLSDRRAASVVEYLVGAGVAADRLRSRGYGESQPIEDNKTDAGRAKNRRVELQKQD